MLCFLLYSLLRYPHVTSSYPNLPYTLLGVLIAR